MAGTLCRRPGGGGRDPRCPQEHPIATCTSRSTGAGQARRPRSPARRAAHVSGAPGQPARPPARPRLTEPRGPAAPPRRRCAPLSAPCLPSAGWARRPRPPPPPPRLATGRPGPPRGLGRAPPAPAPHPASPPRQARGRRLRAAASGRHLRRAARSPPEAASTPGPLLRAAEPPRPHASGRPRPAAPRPLGLRLQRSASSAPATRAAGEEARRRRRRHRGHEHARGGRKERAHGRLALREASPAVVPGKHVHCRGLGGAAGGRLWSRWGELGAELPPRALALGLSSRSLCPAKVQRLQSRSRKRHPPRLRQRLLSSPAADPRILSVHRGGEGALPPARTSSTLAPRLIGG